MQWYNAKLLKGLWIKFVGFIPTFVTGIIVFLFFWWLSKVAKKIVLRVGRARDISEALVNFLSKLVGFCIFIFGIVTALGTMGLDVTTLTASLGLTGFAIGFALKDTISNLISGIMVIFYKTFRKGDFIEVSGVEGHVEEVNLRYTVIHTTDGKVAHVPNSILFSKQILVTKELSITSSDDDGYTLG